MRRHYWNAVHHVSFLFSFFFPFLSFSVCICHEPSKMNAVNKESSVHMKCSQIAWVVNFHEFFMSGSYLWMFHAMELQRALKFFSSWKFLTITNGKSYFCFNSMHQSGNVQIISDRVRGYSRDVTVVNLKNSNISKSLNCAPCEDT